MANKIYPEITKKIIVAFADMFNNLTYPSKNEDIIVPIKYANEERMIAFYRNYTSNKNKYDIRLPQMSYFVASLDPNMESKSNNQNQIASCSMAQYLDNPNSVDYSMQLDIWCRQDQEAQIWIIIEQIVAKFDTVKNYEFTAFEFNDGSKYNYNIPVDLNAITPNFSKYDLDQNTNMVLRATFSFTLKDVKIISTNVHDSVVIDSIKISFEDENNAKFEDLHIFENTGGEVIKEIS